MNKFRILDNLLARCARDLMFIVRDKLTAQPERERPQPVRLLQILGYPGPMSTENIGQAPNERRKELRTRLGSGSLENCPHRGILIDMAAGNLQLFHNLCFKSAVNRTVRRQPSPFSGLLFDDPDRSRIHGRCRNRPGINVLSV
jgi:hypothetical protein